MNKHKRRNYLINKKFQFKFILYTFIPSIFSLVVFYASLNTYFTKLLDQGILSGLPTNHPYFILIDDQQKFMNSLFWLCALYLTLFYCAWGLFISHKIAGPLFRLTKFFKNVDSEEFKGKVSFRPDDFFQEIPLAINEWMEKNYRVKNSYQVEEDSNKEKDRDPK